MAIEDTPKRYVEQSGADQALAALPARLAQVVALSGLSQTDFARKVEMTPGFVSDLLRAVKRPGLDFLVRVKRAFGVSLDWLASGDGTMVGGGGINAELFRAIRLQVALARASVLGGDPTARALVLLVREGQLATAKEDPVFKSYLSGLALSEADVDLAVALYNGHQWTSDPISQRRNIIAAAVAHFETQKPMDPVAAVTGYGAPPSIVQVVSGGSGHRFAGRDYKPSRSKKQ